MNEAEYEKVFRHRITVSADNIGDRAITSSRLQSLIFTVCSGYRVSYSSGFEKGGSVREDGTFAAGESYVVTMTGATDEMAESVARDLCAFLDRKQVTITRDTVERMIITDSVK